MFVSQKALERETYHIEGFSSEVGCMTKAYVYLKYLLAHTQLNLSIFSEGAPI